MATPQRQTQPQAAPDPSAVSPGEELKRIKAREKELKASMASQTVPTKQTIFILDRASKGLRDSLGSKATGLAASGRALGDAGVDVDALVQATRDFVQSRLK